MTNEYSFSNANLTRIVSLFKSDIKVSDLDDDMVSTLSEFIDYITDLDDCTCNEQSETNTDFRAATGAILSVF